jgi:hypothetical protein
MPSNDERVIALSRAKLMLMIAGSVAFIVVGAWFFLASDDGSLITDMRRFVDPWVIHGLGIAAALFGVAGVAWGVAKSFDRKPGLTLSAAGLVDNSSAVAAGFIPWSEVTGLDTLRIQRQRMLVIHVVDPGKYIERGNALKRALNRANAGMCGSPIVISSNALQIPFDELRSAVASYSSRFAVKPDGAAPPIPSDSASEHT